MESVRSKGIQLIPAKVDAYHVVEASVVRSVEVAKSSQSVGSDDRMSTSLGLAETARRTAPLCLLKARKTLGGVVVEVLVGDELLDAEEMLQTAQLTGRVDNQPLTAYEVELI